MRAPSFFLTSGGRSRTLLRFVAVALAAVTGPARAQAQKPNFVIIMADDLGYGDLGCYGHVAVRTPHLDRLAREGMRFSDFHSNGAVCSPTRAALLTGRYQQRAGVQGVITAANHRETGMALGEVTIAEVLKGHGYRTGMFGKWHLGYPAALNPVHQGFDEFSGFVSGNVDYHSHVDQAMHPDWWQRDALENEPGYLTDVITDKGADFIRRHQERPFCLYLAHGAPHYPYQGRQDPAIRAAGQPRSDESVDDFDRRYREMIEVMDEGVGRIVGAIDEAGIGGSTLIVFMSDNGASGRALEGIASVGSLRGAKGSVWEGGIRVPCIARWPGRIPAAGISDALCLSMDWFPTLVEFSGAPLPPGLELDGASLVPVLEGGEWPAPRTVFWSTGKASAVRRGPLKLVVGTQRAGAQLFDLASDLSESADLASIQRETTNALLQALDRWREDVWRNVTPVAR